MASDVPLFIVRGRHRPPCSMSGCTSPAHWVALAEEHRGDEYLGPTDVPLCAQHALEAMTEDEAELEP